jgi:hypothetical protein
MTRLVAERIEENEGGLPLNAAPLKPIDLCILLSSCGCKEFLSVATVRDTGLETVAEALSFCFQAGGPQEGRDKIFGTKYLSLTQCDRCFERTSHGFECSAAVYSGFASLKIEESPGKSCE